MGYLLLSSSKCQILHWRRGHKDECRSPSIHDYDDGEEKENFVESDDTKGSHIESASLDTEEEEMNAHGRTTSISSLPSKASSKPKVSQASSIGLKTSVQRVVHRFRPPK